MSSLGRSSQSSHSRRRSRDYLHSPSLPDRLQPKADEDTTKDVTAPPTTQQANFNLNQSVFQMIAAAGSNVDREEITESGNEDSEDETKLPSLQTRQEWNRQKMAMSMRDPTLAALSRLDDAHKIHKLSKSLSRLRHGSLKRVHQKSRYALDIPIEEPTSSFSEEFSSKDDAETRTIRNVDIQHDLGVIEDLPGNSQISSTSALHGASEVVDNDEEEVPAYLEESISVDELSKQLQEIFDLNVAEEVISEYPCWLLDTVLLEGHLYITSKHICFYAYMPKKQNTILRSGQLSKRGKNNPRYKRYWFILKGDVLSYYTDASELYFPMGNLDLRYAIQAQLVENKDAHSTSTSFTIETSSRMFYFKADSSSSAAEWVKALQKVIFRSHNEGDSKKTTIPLENVLDVEESPILEFAHTFKLRAFHDENFAIDEYFFSFFSFGEDAFQIIKMLVEDTNTQRMSEGILASNYHINGIGDHHLPSSVDGSGARQDDSGRLTPVIKEPVHDTKLHVPPVSPGRSQRTQSSTDPRRLSADLCYQNASDRSSRSSSLSSQGRQKPGKGSVDNSNRPGLEARLSSSQFESQTESWSRSVDRSGSITASSDAFQTEDEDMSGSRLLSGSDIFQNPTMQGFPTGPSEANRTASPSQKQSENASGPHTTLPINIQSRSGQGSSSLDDTHSSGEQRSSSFQEIAKMGSYPLQKAADIAEWMKRRSRKMGELVTTESMGYLEKVSDMWTGKLHYDDNGERKMADENMDADIEDEDNTPNVNPQERFRKHFALPAREKLVAAWFGYLYKGIPVYGKMYLGTTCLCFRPLLPGAKPRMMILPLQDIENVDQERGFRFGFSGLVFSIKGHQEEFFEFGQVATRDDCGATIRKSLEALHLQKNDLNIGLPDPDESRSIAAKKEHDSLSRARVEGGHGEHDLKLPTTTSVLASDHTTKVPPIIFDDPHTSIINFKPTESLRFTCLTIGSRGDVQPYIALCKGLAKEGHRVKIATHAEFQDWVESHGIEFAVVDGDPAELMRICVENGMFTYSFLREATSKFRGWIDDLLRSAWLACQDTDVLIESPSAMAGIHIAEALRIPYFRAFTMPWTRTRAYPHAFAVPNNKKGGSYNWFTYVLFDSVFWKAISGQVNRWRKSTLGLRSTSLSKMDPDSVPFLYNFSPHVVVPPLDFSDWVRVTGYWFLNESQTFDPPKDILDFIAKARADDKKIVYVGFGSIVVSDPRALTQTVIDSVLKADVRCILSKGWSDRLGSKDVAAPEIPLPPEILSIKATPHDWLFKQVDAAVHHGGAGTTGASLRAGLPTIIKPFFGDQFFFGGRVEDLGVGICMKKLNVPVFSRALWEATESTRMRAKAKLLGEQIRNEDGVDTAIEAIYRDMEYARTLIKQPIVPAGPDEPWTIVTNNDSDEEEEDEEDDNDENEEDAQHQMSQSIYHPLHDEESESALTPHAQYLSLST